MPPRRPAALQLLCDGLRIAPMLALLPALLTLLGYAVAVLIVALDKDSLSRSLRAATGDLPSILQGALLLAGAWVLFAALLHRPLMDIATGAVRVTTPEEEPRLWLLAAELAVRAGRPMPRLSVIETPGRNLLAYGLVAGRGDIAVTRGLLDALDDRALSAALAQASCRIADGTARLGLVAGLLAAPLALATDPLWQAARVLLEKRPDPPRGEGRQPKRGARSRRGGAPPPGPARRSDGGSALSLLVLAPALAAALPARLLALPLRRAVPRRRVLAADAAAVALTRDPPALAAALWEVALHPALPGLADPLRGLALADPAPGGGWLSSHPPVADRLAAIPAGGADDGATRG